MKLKRVKTIFLLAILVSIFSISNVKALSQCTTVFPPDEDGITDITDTFGFDMDKNTNGTYTIKAKPQSDDANYLKKLKKVKFKITDVQPAENNGGLIGQELDLSKENKLTVNISGSTELSIGPGVEVTLTSVNLEGAGICKGWGTVTVQVADYYGDTIHEEGEFEGAGDISIEAGKEIKCDTNHMNSYDHNSFERKFCEAKLGAKNVKKKDINNKTTYRTGLNDADFKELITFDESEKFAFRCDVNWGGTAEKEDGTTFKINTIDEALKFINNPEYGYYFQENTSYLYGEGERKVNLGYYYFHYHNNQKTQGKPITCHIKCEEAVTVKYGPPVADKAGMCFDYQIKVESRVNCHAISELQSPPKKYRVCTPHPYCKSKTGHVYNQGGPNEEFEECVESCDGGKYTDRCTTSCYKKIYKNSNKAISTDLITPEMRLMANERTLDDAEKWFAAAKSGNANPPKGHSSTGAYVLVGGSINWYNTITVKHNKIVGGNDGNHKGRWYFHHSWGFNHPYPRIENGIPRSKYCTDKCHWQHNCDSDEYLNWGVAEEDYRENYEIYKDAVDKCNAMSKCQTNTSTYTISATYKQKGGEEKTLSFPKGTTTDLHSCEFKKTEDVNEGVIKNPADVVKRFDGCYADIGCCYKKTSRDFCDGKNELAGKYYMSEWTFPGSYKNRKTGEISYDPSLAGNTEWRTIKRRFCLPRDAGPTNTYWYYWYYATHEGYGDRIANDYCVTAGLKEFLSKTETTYDTSKQYANIDWNINGSTRGFGYFKWNIDLSCFFALDDGTDPHTTVTTTDNETAETNCKNTEYRVRTVSNTELFPSSTSEETVEGVTAGRTPGFNWSNKAELTEAKVGANFANDPEEVKEYIESVKNSIYSSGDKYVDYQFKLTPQIISNIKAYNSQVKSYDTYCGKMVDIKNTKGETVFYAYESNLFRNSGVDAKACPNTNLTNVDLQADRLGNILCNNDADNHTDCKTEYKVN